MNNEFAPEFLSLIDDDGNEHSFEILDTVVVDDREYYALYPIYEDAQDEIDDPGEYYIMEVVDVDGEQQLAELEDDALLDSLAEIFEAHFAEMYDENSDEE